MLVGDATLFKGYKNKFSHQTKHYLESSPNKGSYIQLIQLMNQQLPILKKSLEKGKEKRKYLLESLRCLAFAVAKLQEEHNGKCMAIGEPTQSTQMPRKNQGDPTGGLTIIRFVNTVVISETASQYTNNHSVRMQ